MQQNWEYKVVNIGPTTWKLDIDAKFEEDLSALGQEGWELVSVIGQPADRRQAFFKKPKG